MLKIEILGGPRSIGYTDKKTGAQASFQVQEAALHQPGKKYPTPFEFAVPRGTTAVQPGIYELSPDSIYVNARGSLAISPRLKIVAAAADPLSGTRRVG